MLRSAKSFFGVELKAQDGYIGHCRDILFEDRQWAARYLVANTGAWLSEHLVLISAYSLSDPDLARHTADIPVSLTKQQIEESPLLESNAPVSRLHELEMARFFRNPLYWEGESLWGPHLFPRAEDLTPPTPEEWEHHERALEAIEESHLRSIEELIDYRIEAKDGEIGHIDDIIIECETWALRYLVVDTHNWLPGRKVLIAPTWASGIDWYEAHVGIELDRESIRKSPPYDPLKAVNRDYEGKLYDYYGEPVYY